MAFLNCSTMGICMTITGPCLAAAGQNPRYSALGPLFLRSEKNAASAFSRLEPDCAMTSVLSVSAGCVTVCATTPEHSDAVKCRIGPSRKNESDASLLSFFLTVSYVASCDPLSVAARVMQTPHPRHKPATPSRLAISINALAVDLYGLGPCMRIRTTSMGLNSAEPIAPVPAPATTRAATESESPKTRVSTTASRTAGYMPIRNPVYEKAR
mmetsp:Transcript_10034/g.42198  ORF Transcript_10034/g.42198 Transcript_10034/m.42198 type:complete len:212 (+) Transcript_10034:1368-2003(+)